MKNIFELSENDKKQLLQIARSSIESYLTNKTLIEIKTEEISENLNTKCGAFVTLHQNKILRGCIGNFSQETPLYKVVQEMAIASSTQDSRFSPVTKSEISSIEIEISVLTPLTEIKNINEIILGKHGIYIIKGNRGGTFLPQVASETGWNLEEFLGHCARDKAGIGWDGWKDAKILIYEAIIFSEKNIVN